MIDIKVAKHAGFCFGVKRAIEVAEEIAQNNPNKKTYVLGQLVHNERVIKNLEEKGIVFVGNIHDIPKNSITVLRAHGEPGTTYEILEQKSITKGNNLNDATCPLVTLVHNVAIRLKDAGYDVILYGKHNHPEAIGTSYHLKGKGTFIVDHEDDYQKVIDYIYENNFKKIAIISQTTMSVFGYQKLIENVNENFGNRFVKIPLALTNLDAEYVFVDTICNPTKQRQSDIDELAKDRDIIIVIGGKNSSNSKELHAKAKEYGVESYFIQSCEQLEKKWFSGKNKIGVTAGASTPDYLIGEVEEKIKEIVGVK